MERKIFIDLEQCVGCGDCSLICPVLVYTTSIPPCQSSCPINTDVQEYVSLIAQGRFKEALIRIRQTNPFAGIIGRVCTHPCQQECRRADIDDPIAICALKRAAADYAESIFEDLNIGEDRSKKIAIVGGGPAGLMAAYDLRKMGYQVTIFEAFPFLGGMLAVGIPQYRLPREILQQEIGIIPKLGIEIKLNTRVGDEIKFSDLKERFDAIFLATGAHLGRTLGIEGEEKEGVVDGIKFLRDINLGAKMDKGERKDKVIVVGGGNVAVDCARTCLRLGFKEVVILYRRSRNEMPAIAEEIREAEKEGVSTQFLAAPAKILSENGKANGVTCVKMRLDTPDTSGRKRPVPIEGSEFTMKTEMIISAIGEQPDLSFLKGERLVFTSEGLLESDPETLETSHAGVFAGGDAVTGSATAIQAMGAGKKAAIHINEYLENGVVGKSRAQSRVEREERMWWQKIVKDQGQRMAELPVTERTLTFRETKLGLTRESALKEARRCLGCKIFAELDLESCLAGTCQQCADYCWKAAISILKK